MLQNFFKVAFRNLVRHAGFSFINIAGLTLGVTACLLIGLFVWDEFQYDKNVPNAARIYRVYNQYTNNEGTDDRAPAPPMFSTTLKNDFPEVEQTARVLMLPENKTLFEAANRKMYEESGYYVDSTFLDVFAIPFKWGAAPGALDNAASILLSEEMAQRFFGKENPVGKQMLMDKMPMLITGVFRKDPTFHLQFNYLVPMAAAGIPASRMQSWGWQQFYHYVKLKQGASVVPLEAKFQKVVDEKTKASNPDDEGSNIAHFQPLQKIHLYSANFKYDAAQRGNIMYVRALGIIAIFILLIACFNFINLATAKSLQRAKEVGVRKTIGAERRQLMVQFVSETVLLAFISVIISVALALVILPWLNTFTGKHISNSIFLNPLASLLLLGLTLLVGVGAGFYPALVLSGFKPIKVLKGSFTGNEEPGKVPWLRHGLVVLQFALSVLLIISVVVVFKQVDYLHNKNLGFNKDQIMFFPVRGENMSDKYEAFKNDLLQSPGIAAVSIGYGFPGDAVAGDGIIVNHNGQEQEQYATQLMVDYDYIKTLGLQLVAGRAFSKDMKTDGDHAFIINERAVTQLGFGTPEKALGQTLKWHVWNDENPDSLKVGQVIGVVKDFHYKSLYDKVETTVLQIFPVNVKVAVKIKAGNMESAVNHVKKVWSKYSQEYPIEYKFLDNNFEMMYRSEDKLRTLLLIFTCIAVFVGCLGLFGLAAYTAERRRKEVGIRKVLGASTSGVVMLLSKDFIKLVVVALVVASPVAYYLMQRWLQDFAYRIDIGWQVFAIAACTAISIAFATVSFQAIKAAISNPVNSLRTE